MLSPPSSKSLKRLCTLVVTVSGDKDHEGEENKQPKWACTFKGLGKRIAADERASWHPDVAVFFQENAWQNRPNTADLVAAVHKPYCEARSLASWLLEWDNADPQRTSNVIDEIRSLKGDAFFGSPHKTHGWQQIDAGSLGAIIKGILGDLQQEWLCCCVCFV